MALPPVLHAFRMINSQNLTSVTESLETVLNYFSHDCSLTTCHGRWKLVTACAVLNRLGSGNSLDLNLSWGARYPDEDFIIFLSPISKSQNSASIRPQPCLPKPFQIHHSSVILPFSAM
jgi:hypothetical protein